MQEACEQAESKKNDATGPWKTSTTQQAEAKPAVEEAEKGDLRPAEELGQKARYVPPGMRNLQPQQPLSATRLRSIRSSKAPEIENQSEFPSLGAAVPAEVEADPKPAAGGINSWKESTVRSAVRTENKFDALSEN